MRNLRVFTTFCVLGGFALSDCSNPQKPILTLADAQHASIGAMTGTTGIVKEVLDITHFSNLMGHP